MPNQNSTQMTRRAFLAVGLMLFALFFGAGNLIFPAALGQRAGTNVWWAVMGFVLTGVGLPLAGVLAMGYSGCRNVQELAGRVHPLFGILFTLALYLSIGPAFAIPRTGTVSFEIAVRPFLSPDAGYWAQIVFLIVFFLVTLWLSINPQKLVGRIGGILTPMLLTTIVVLIVKSLITPPGTPGSPTEAYATPAVALQQGFIDGYNTLDALASFVFGILVIEFVTQHGATTRHEVMGATMRAGMIAIGCLGVVYVFIAGLGAASVEQLGILNTGAPVLAGSARLLFGEPGALILAVIVLLACLTTSIGLVTACASYFHSQFGGLSYKGYAVAFVIISFAVGTFGLKTIISAAVPVLMFLYPLAIVLIALAFLDSRFGSRRSVYAWTVGLTLISALISGLEAANISLGAFGRFYGAHVPLHADGLDWIFFALAGFLIGCLNRRKSTSSELITSGL